MNALKATQLCTSKDDLAFDTSESCPVVQAGRECHGTGAQPEAGWCYIDPSQNPDDDASLVDRCPEGQKRFIRFVDPENRPPEPDAALFIACQGSTP